MSSDPQADAFVRMILEQPDELTGHLVFADWLDETGKPGNEAWARYIRAKAETPRYPAGTPERRGLDRIVSAAVTEITARLTVPAELFVRYPRSLIQLLPPPNLAVSLDGSEIPRAVVELVPESVARENQVLPLALQGRTLLVAATDPCDGDLIQKLDFILNVDTLAVGCDADDMSEAIDHYYGNTETEFVDSILVDFTDTAGPTRTEPAAEPWDDTAPVARLVAVILAEAIHMRADRAQLVPESDSLPVRFRIDGEWIERDRMPLRLSAPLTDRVVFLCGLWRGLPGDRLLASTCRFTFRGLTYTIGVTISPGEFGATIDFDIPDRFEIPEVTDTPLP